VTRLGTLLFVVAVVVLGVAALGAILLEGAPPSRGRW
jgi:hypothetical protein